MKKISRTRQDNLLQAQITDSVRETQSVFQRRAQRSAFRHPDVRLQSRSLAPLESIAETQPQTKTSFAEIVSDDFPILHVLTN